MLADGADDTSLPAAQSPALVLGLVHNLVHDLQLGGDKNPRQSRRAHCQKSLLVFVISVDHSGLLCSPVVLCCVEVLQQFFGVFFSGCSFGWRKMWTICLN